MEAAKYNHSQLQHSRLVFFKDYFSQESFSWSLGHHLWYDFYIFRLWLHQVWKEGCRWRAGAVPPPARPSRRGSPTACRSAGPTAPSRIALACRETCWRDRWWPAHFHSEKDTKTSRQSAEKVLKSSVFLRQYQPHSSQSCHHQISVLLLLPAPISTRVVSLSQLGFNAPV